MRTALLLMSLTLLTVGIAADETLPSPWKHQDIGAAKMPGSAAHSAGTFTVEGTMDLWGVADGAQVVWQPVRGDAELSARVKAMDNPGGVAHAKAGLCFRESLDAGARHVTVCVTATDGTQFLYRDKTDGKTARLIPEADAPVSEVAKGKFPCWLKVVRKGNEFSGYDSVDGQTWRLAGRIKLDLSADAVVALTASSHKADVLVKAEFDDVKVVGGSAEGTKKP